jgi:hypothetical protein
MVKRIFILLTLIGLLLVSVSPGFASQKVNRLIKVSIYFQGPESWGGEFHVWNKGEIKEINPLTHAARGKYNWTIFNPEFGWRSAKSDVICVAYGQDGHNAAFIARITEINGWGQGVPGEYAYFWLKDGKSTGESDASAVNYYSFDPFYEFWPAGDPPDCNYFDPRPYDIPVIRGNIRFIP